MTLEQFEQLLEDWFQSRKDYEDMLHREDWVHWSEEAEHEAFMKQYKIKQKILSMLSEE